MVKILLLIAGLVFSPLALAQPSPGPGPVPSCPISGCQYTGKISAVQSAAASAGFNLSCGLAPTTPQNGDMWCTPAGLWLRIGAATVGPFGIGTGTVQSVGVVTANGFAGSVGSPTANPLITIQTTFSGVAKGSGGALVPATAGTDYLTPTGDGSGLVNMKWVQIGSTPTTLAGYGITDAVGKALSSGMIYAGSGSNLAAPVTPSGDVTMSNLGAFIVAKTNGVAFGTFATQNSATPPPIGGTTPNAGTFSSLNLPFVAGTQCLRSVSGVVGGTSCGGVVLTGVIDVISTYGADVTGATEVCGVSGPLQQAINAAQSAAHGAFVYLGDGIFLDNAGCIVSNGIPIVGAGWEANNGSQNAHNPTQLGTHGTYIKSTTAANSPFTFTGSTWGAQLREMAFFQNQPAPTTGWTPTVYPPTILATAASTFANGGPIIFDHLFCWNCYQFFQIGQTGLPAGAVQISNVSGTPLKYGIVMAYTTDIPSISHVHFWSYFDDSAFDVQTWRNLNGTALLFYRNDDLQMNDIFVYSYQYGIDMERSSDGNTQGVNATNMLFDGSLNGVVVNVAGAGGWSNTVPNEFTNVSISNLTSADPATVGYCVYANAAIWMDFTNVSCNFNKQQAVLANVTGADLSFTNSTINNWNTGCIPTLCTTFPAFGAVPGAIITLSGRSRTNFGVGAPLTGGGGTFNTAHVN